MCDSLRHWAGLDRIIGERQRLEATSAAAAARGRWRQGLLPAGRSTLHPMTTLDGVRVRLRPVTDADRPALVAIRRSPEVFAWWRGGTDLYASVEEDIAEPGAHPFVIEVGQRVAGWIQWHQESEPDYRYATIDLYLHPALHGQGLGADAVRTMARHLFDDHSHHRLEIDPAADNHAAIACYAKVGFRPVGIRRQSERGNDGTWHDALLMDLLAAELTAEASGPG
jgi:aminoglycoside 6'-N-acetyltransferase